MRAGIESWQIVLGLQQILVSKYLRELLISPQNVLIFVTIGYKFSLKCAKRGLKGRIFPLKITTLDLITFGVLNNIRYVVRIIAVPLLVAPWIIRTPGEKIN